MKLVHLTAKRFLYTTADNFYIRNLAVNFNNQLGNNYLLVVGDKEENDFQGISCINLKLKPWVSGGILYFWSQYIYYIFWLPYFFIKNKIGNESTIFSSDSTLLPAMIIWKKLLGLKFKVCSDWHMLYNNWRDRYIARNSDYLITTSEKLRNQIIAKAGISPQKIKTVYGGVDLIYFADISKEEARKKLGLPIDKILLGYVGLFKTMGMEKGLKTIVEALKYLPENFQAVLKGARNNESEEYGSYARSLTVADRVIIANTGSFEEAALYQLAADALVIPYPDKPHFRNYGFPMKVYEHMAARRPIIYSKLELTEEILEDCGFIFQPENAQDLAKIAFAVLDKNNREEVEKKVNIAYNKVVDLTWEHKTRKILDFISQN